MMKHLNLIPKHGHCLQYHQNKQLKTDENVSFKS